MTERILLSELMKPKQEVVSSTEKPIEPEVQPIESSEEKERAEQIKREKEGEQWLKMAQLRHRLGLPQLESPNGEVFVPEENKKEVAPQEEKEVLVFAMKRLLTDLEELSVVLSRKKFPKVRFESGKLEEITFSLNRIRLPEDRRDMMELEPRNYTAVLDAMEKVEGDLLKLRGAIEESKKEDILIQLMQVSEAMKKLRSKKELFQGAVGALRRYKYR
jgi:hypothetical protein